MTTRRALLAARTCIMQLAAYAPPAHQKDAEKAHRAITKALDAKTSEMELKAAAFNSLVSLLDGQHTTIRRFQREKPREPVSTFDPKETGPQTLELENWRVVEWTLRYQLREDVAADLAKLLIKDVS